MSGLLESLAQGLRVAGGTLSRDVYQANERQDLQANSQEQQQRNFLLQNMMQSIQSGAVPAPPGLRGMVGANPEVAQRAEAQGLLIQKQKRELALEEAKKTLFASPQFQEIIGRANAGDNNANAQMLAVMFSKGLLDPVTYQKELTTLRTAEANAKKPVAMGRGGLAVPDANEPSGYRIIEPPAQPAKTATPKAPGTTRSFQIGDQEVTQELQADGQWKEIGRGAKFSPGSNSLGEGLKAIAGAMGLGKPAQNKIDESLIDTTKNLMQLDQIQSGFKPEYQTFATRGTQWWNSTKEKLGADLNPNERKSLTEFSAYKRNAIDSLNQYIKSITGAAMTNAEAERILKGLPNAGAGLFDGDSPTEFKAKLDDAISKTRMSVARLAYIKRNQMSLEDGRGNAVISLERMPSLMNERGKSIEEELKKTGKFDAPTLSKAVRRQLAIEFGLSSD